MGFMVAGASGNLSWGSGTFSLPVALETNDTVFIVISATNSSFSFGSTPTGVTGSWTQWPKTATVFGGVGYMTGCTAGATSITFSGTGGAGNFCILVLRGLSSSPSINAEAGVGTGQVTTTSGSYTQAGNVLMAASFSVGGSGTTGSPSFSCGAPYIDVANNLSGSENYDVGYGIPTSGSTTTYTGVAYTGQSSYAFFVSLTVLPDPVFAHTAVRHQAVQRASTWFSRVPRHEKPGGLVVPERRLILAGS